MKTSLLAAFVAALLAAGFLYFRRTRADAGPSVEPPPAASAQKATPPPEVRLEAAGKDAAAPAPVDPATRIAAGDAGAPPRAAEDAPPALTDFGAADAGDSAAASLEGARSAAYAEYAKKYQGTSAENRKRARQSIEALLLAHKRGTLDKATALSAEQVVELSIEAEWLDANSGG